MNGTPLVNNKKTFTSRSELNNTKLPRVRAIPDCDLQEIRTLKAFISYDTIVDPEHPLAVDDGGLKAYLGAAPPLLAHTKLSKTITILFRHSPKWREEVDVQFGSNRIHPVLAARDETHERAGWSPFVGVPHPRQRPPARLYISLQERPRIQEGSKGTVLKSQQG